MSSSILYTSSVDIRTQFNELLISTVEKLPIIWDISHPDHKNPKRVAVLWEDVAKELNSTVKMVMNRWRNLRDTYRKYLKKVIDSSKSGAGGSEASVCKWTHFEQLRFLTSSLTSRQPYICRTPGSLKMKDIDNLEPIIIGDMIMAEENEPSEYPYDEGEQFEVPPVPRSRSASSIPSHISQASDELLQPVRVQVTSTPQFNGTFSMASEPSTSSQEIQQPAKKRRRTDQASQRFLDKIDKQISRNVHSREALDSLLVSCMRRESDHIESFLMSLAPQMRETPRELLPSLKMHLMYIITKYSRGIIPSKLISLDL